MNRIDLHAHSTRSDGTLSPVALVEYAVQKGLSAIALTDHDTVDGIDEALMAGHEKNLTVIPGIEFSTSHEGTDIHILGLFIDHHNAYFQGRLTKFVESRVSRNQEMCEKLQAAGIDITYEKLVAEYPGGILTRSHYASYLLNHGYIRNYKEAFELYIGDDKPCFVPRHKITPFRAVEIILKGEGLPILAHPFHYHLSDTALDRLTGDLAAAGLAGIEVCYSTHSSADERQLKKLAAKYHLAVSGGSDFHGDAKPGLDLGNGYGNLFVPESILDGLVQEWNRRQESPQDFRTRKILFTDLDGTLLNDAKQISPYTREILDAWSHAGHRLVLCSGRDINSVTDVRDELGLHYPGMFLIGSNGGRIYDCDRETLINKASLTNSQAIAIIKSATEHGIHCHTYTDTHIIAPAETEALFHYTQIIHTPVIIAEDVGSVLTDEPSKCIAIESRDPARLQRFREFMQASLGPEIAMLVSSPHFLEFIPAVSGKGNALLKLCDILGIPPALSVAAGDQENDLSMLQAAGYAIAMSNGTDTVKKEATVVTSFNNNQDGLAHALVSLL